LTCKKNCIRTFQGKLSRENFPGKTFQGKTFQGKPSRENFPGNTFWGKLSREHFVGETFWGKLSTGETGMELTVFPALMMLDAVATATPELHAVRTRC
jgi:hypothetical protein